MPKVSDKTQDCVLQCLNCAYYRAEPGDEHGRCHRNPPVMVPEGNGYSFDFPSVNEDDFCGKFETGGN